MELSNSSGFAIINSMIAIQDEDEENIITRKNKELENHFEDILCSSEKTHQELWHDIEENEQLLELLWNQESVNKPVMNEENNQLFIREDEMSRTLDCFDETTRATADFFCEFVEHSLRNISKDEVKEKEGNVINLSEESLIAADIENASKVDETVHERALVQCSVHGNCNSKKRKERVGKNIGFYNEDVDDIFGKTLQTSQPAPLRKRAADIHNISEKKRRDRINEKMKTLQKLIPRCNKSNKASMLDDAIEYLKSLQLQVQMMSTTLQYNMGQMIFPNTQSYMGCMGNLGMGMGMNRPSVEMQRPMMPLGSLMPYPTMMLPQYASSHAQLNPSFHMGVASIPDARIEASNHHDQISNPVAMVSSGMVQLPSISEPYRYCSGLHYHQAPTQSQVMVQPSQIFEDTENSRRQS